MTWIKTIPSVEAEGELKALIERQRALYPIEYAKPGYAVAPGGSIVESHSLIRRPCSTPSPRSAL